jgi:hypothetical protein
MKKFAIAELAVCVVALVMAGCTSQSQQADSSQQKEENAKKMAPRGPVELTVGFCDSQREVPARKQVVSSGEIAVFDPTDVLSYELKVRPLKTADGKILLITTAFWQDATLRQDVLFSRQMLANNGEMSPKIVLNISGKASCFTITALSGSAN